MAWRPDRRRNGRTRMTRAPGPVQSGEGIHLSGPGALTGSHVSLGRQMSAVMQLLHPTEFMTSFGNHSILAIISRSEASLGSLVLMND
ncbi:hypothetical protein PoB_007127200 [Plakobranchus ocellatus]|uniref:Uncharacterized protein n=1 Tax=Plakobranchus ocellatus TaxID=259542 RepID=A0AAV4DL43_9GAST|nr:hypothetical protein PoB_007127200 [Plakobranchus ocellatus]